MFLKRKKTIVTVLDNFSMKRLIGLKKKLYFLFWLKLPLLRCGQIISISKNTTNELIKYLPESKNKILQIDICVQKKFKKNPRRINNLPIVLICVSY